MMDVGKRLRDVIDVIDYYELLKIKDDLKKGGIHIQKFIEDEIVKREKEHYQVCAVCMNNIDPDSKDAFTLLFGPADFRKKATFCGKDCMQYFMSKMDDMKKGEMPKSMP
jgi:hypothetical protein